MSSQMNLDDLNVDTANLYREEAITDLKVASIRRMIPILVDGSDDSSRPTLYMGSSTIMTGGGPMPISAEIDATNLAEALEKFPAAIQAAIEEMIERAREYQREQSSRIVVPDAQTASKIHIS